MQGFGREKGGIPNKCGASEYRIADNNKLVFAAVSFVHRPHWRMMNRGVTYVKTCDVSTGNAIGGSGYDTGRRDYSAAGSEAANWRPGQ